MKDKEAEDPYSEEQWDRDPPSEQKQVRGHSILKARGCSLACYPLHPAHLDNRAFIAVGRE